MRDAGSPCWNQPWSLLFGLLQITPLQCHLPHQGVVRKGPFGYLGGRMDSSCNYNNNNLKKNHHQLYAIFEEGRGTEGNCFLSKIVLATPWMPSGVFKNGHMSERKRFSSVDSVPWRALKVKNSITDNTCSQYTVVTHLLSGIQPLPFKVAYLLHPISLAQQALCCCKYDILPSVIVLN